MAAAALAGVLGALLGAVGGLFFGAKARPVVVDDGSRSRELLAAAARRLAEGRADKLQLQVDRLRAACLLPADAAGAAVDAGITHSPDAAARLVRMMGGVSGAVVAGADGLSKSARETPYERALAATVAALAPVSTLSGHLGAVQEVVVVLRSGLGVRARMIGKDEMLVIAATGGVPSALLTRAVVAELNVAAPMKPAVAPAASFELGASTVIKELATRAGLRTVAMLSGDRIDVAVSMGGLSLESLRALRRPLQLCADQLASVFASPVARLELYGVQQLSMVAGDLGWWLALHPSAPLDDMAVRRLEGAHRVSLQTRVA